MTRLDVKVYYLPRVFAWGKVVVRRTTGDGQRRGVHNLATFEALGMTSECISFIYCLNYPSAA